MKKSYFTQVLIFSIFIFISSNGVAREDSTKIISRIDSIFSPWAKNSSPGCAIAIYKEGKVYYSQGYGMANLEYNIPNSPNTIFHLASISKQITSFAILLLEKEGKLKLDDDIRKHYPEVNDFGETITIKHLLTHTSGFRDQWELLQISGWRMDDVITKDHIVKLIEGQRELNFEPGTEYLYSNSGYSILARIVEKVSGISFNEFVHERIFIPLEMTDTHIHDDHEMVVKNRAYSYNQDKNGSFKKSVLSYANDGATSVFSTVMDLSKWIDNMLTGELGGKELVNKMKQRGILSGGDTLNYGLGLSIGKHNGSLRIGHGGADAGFRSTIQWYPAHDLGIVILCNLASMNPSSISNRITDLFIERPPEIEIKEKEIIQLDSLLLKEFEGKFDLDMGLTFTVNFRDSTLIVHQLWNDKQYPIQPVSNNFFIPLEMTNVGFRFSKTNGIVNNVIIEEGEQKFHGMKIDNEDFTFDYLDQYKGEYYNIETRTTYFIQAADSSLIMQHQKHEDIILKLRTKDTFRGNKLWLVKVQFIRDKNENISEFLLSGNRVKNLKFKKR